MALTEAQRVERRKAKRHSEKADLVEDLTQHLREFCQNNNKVVTSQHLIRLCREAVYKLSEDPDSSLQKSPKKRAKTDILNYKNIDPLVWEELYEKVDAAIVSTDMNRCIVTKSKNRPTTTIKDIQKDKWLQGGGDERWSIMSTHIVLCSGGFFPKSITDEASHLCHNKKCLHPQHLRWEPKWLNAEREECRLMGYCKGHVNHAKCRFSA